MGTATLTRQCSKLTLPDSSFYAPTVVSSHPPAGRDRVKPATITPGARSVRFLHNVDHQRFKQGTTESTTLYIAAFGVVAELLAPGTQGARWNDYLSVGNVRVGVRFTEVNSQTVSTRYFHTLRRRFPNPLNRPWTITTTQDWAEKILTHLTYLLLS